MFILNLQVKR